MINGETLKAQRTRRSCLPLMFVSFACSGQVPVQGKPHDPEKRVSIPDPTPTSSPTPLSAETHSTPDAPPPHGTACGALDCRAFDSAPSALSHLLQKTSPYVLAVGEIHAQKGNTLKATPTQRFSQLLPLFRGRARHLVLELWTGRNDCGDDRVAKVKEAQKPVVQAQAASNQNDYFELGTKAKAEGIFPHALVPNCNDYQTILDAKSEDISKMLELTAVKTLDTLETLLRQAGNVTQTPFIITYGGALHNDVTPKPGRESWSFGPQLRLLTQGRFVELDLVLREQVRDTESFRSLPWYPYFQEEPLEQSYVLYKTGDMSYTLVFPLERYLP